MQYLFREKAIEHMDKWTQAKSADQGTGSQQAAGEETNDGTQTVGDHPAPEIWKMPVIIHHQRESIVRGDAGIGRLVQGNAQGCHQDADQHDEQAEQQAGRRAEPGGQKIVRPLGEIS